MTEKDTVGMTLKELRRLQVIQEAIKRHITQQETASALSLSERQVRRLVKAVRLKGEVGIIHQRRGKPSNRKILTEIREKVIRLYREKYPGFGPLLAKEKLLERDGVRIGKETLRGWLIEEGLWEKHRRRKKHRRWRERKTCFGQMLQMDGSHHDWLEGRGPELVLMSCIDDATSKVFAHFYSYEGTFPAMDSFRGYIDRYGIPQSVYVDRHTTYHSTRKLTIEEELEGVRRPKTQFERALDELGVEIIPCYSPQAKGRIERLFRTFQDRLIKEMRVANISTLEGANRFLGGYLPVHNQRFSITPAKEANLHREIPKGINLDKIFSKRTKRALRGDFTIVHNKQLYQIEKTPLHTRIKHVVVEERIDGIMHITYNDFNLKYRKIETRPPQPKEERLPEPRKTYIPPPDHPWRRSNQIFFRNRYREGEKGLPLANAK